MPVLTGRNIVVLDLETLHSAEDCRHCHRPEETHRFPQDPVRCPGPGFLPIGWRDSAALGLSIGAYYDYQDGVVHWFDQHTLVETMQHLVDRQPLLVSFNGIGFDFKLMRALLRHEADDPTSWPTLDITEAVPKQEALHALCDQFKALAATSYDILAEIWRADPARKFERGLNSLDALLAANGFPAKSGHGAQAPRDWQAGRIATVLEYCQRDVLLTRAFFERILDQSGTLERRDGPITVRMPILPSLYEEMPR